MVSLTEVQGNSFKDFLRVVQTVHDEMLPLCRTLYAAIHYGGNTLVVSHIIVWTYDIG